MRLDHRLERAHKSGKGIVVTTNSRGKHARRSLGGDLRTRAHHGSVAPDSHSDASTRWTEAQLAPARTRTINWLAGSTGGTGTYRWVVQALVIALVLLVAGCAADDAGDDSRTQRGVEIPEEVDQVVVEGRDSEYGYGGGTVTVPLPD